MPPSFSSLLSPLCSLLSPLSSYLNFGEKRNIFLLERLWSKLGAFLSSFLFLFSFLSSSLLFSSFLFFSLFFSLFFFNNDRWGGGRERREAPGREPEEHLKTLPSFTLPHGYYMYTFISYHMDITCILLS